MKSSDVMTREVVSVKPDSSVLDAARLMLQKRISGLPVIDGAGNLVGIISEGDLLRRTETETQRRRPRWIELIIGPGKLAEEYVRSSGRQVHEIMTEQVYTVSEDTPLVEVVQQMERRRIKRLPVMRGNTVVGIITRTDLMRVLVNVSHEVKPLSAEDSVIRERLIAELNTQPWAPVATIDVFVRNGVVKLSGTVMDDRERRALRVAAENIPGVKSVEDQLVWIEPMSGLAVETQST
ncbi:MAG: CBS domain-containing protein [Candidatus Binatia bacterium]